MLENFTGDCTFTLPDGLQTIALAGPDPLTLELIGEPGALPLSSNTVVAREYYELRLYRGEEDDSSETIEQYLRDRFVPACNRNGVWTLLSTVCDTTFAHRQSGWD